MLLLRPQHRWKLRLLQSPMEELAADAGRGGVAGEHQSQHVRRSRLMTQSCPQLVTQSCARLQSSSQHGTVANGNWLVGVGLTLS
jgi:hypothetical protein